MTGTMLEREALRRSVAEVSTMQQLPNPGRPSPARAGYRVDVSRGERIGRVSSEWFSRPVDERYLSLTLFYGT